MNPVRVVTAVTALLLSLSPCRAVLLEQPLQLLADQGQSNALAAPQHLSGYFSLNHTYGPVHMFYLWFEARSDAANAPVVLWMTGGPGCSSELAVFYENGPYHIHKNLTLEANKYGWDQAANMLYIDQPVGTGFSYSDDPRDDVTDEAGVAVDVLLFLQEFMEAHPEQAHKPLFITGESYGGHYVPAVSYAIFLQNKLEGSYKFNFKGLAIGNGLTNPAIQYGAYADFAELNGLIDSSTRDGIKTVYPVCKFLANACNGYPWVPLLCSFALSVCQSTQAVATLVATGQNLNVYDIRKPCEGPLCYDFSRLDRYLSQPEVRAKLGVAQDLDFQECSFTVNAAFASDYARRFDVPDLLDMLNETPPVKVLIYAGVKDFICNWLGNERWLNELQWEGLDRFIKAPEADVLLPNGTVGGTMRSYGPLTFTKVLDAGHMVPMDQPEFALQMFADFVGSKSFASQRNSSSSFLQRPGSTAGTQAIQA